MHTYMYMYMYMYVHACSWQAAACRYIIYNYGVARPPSRAPRPPHPHLHSKWTIFGTCGERSLQLKGQQRCGNVILVDLEIIINYNREVIPFVAKLVTTSKKCWGSFHHVAILDVAKKIKK